jgi:hypothetical protein
MEPAEGGSLRADETLRPDILAIGADDLDVIVVVEMNLEPAHALAQWALTEKDPGAIGLGAMHAPNNGRSGDRNFHWTSPRGQETR